MNRPTPIHLTERDLYAVIGEQSVIIRVQEQMIAELQQALANGHGGGHGGGHDGPYGPDTAAHGANHVGAHSDNPGD